MHPSEEIFCEKSSKLKGKTVIMGITGSIAATECFGAVRELIRHGATVRAVMSPEACKLVTPETMEYACGTAPVTELTGKTEHITMMREASLMLIYPATANTVSKIALGIDDTAVTSFATVALGSGIPMAIAPAMHDSMYRNPAVAENLERLRAYGLTVIGPRLEDGKAKVASKEQVIETVLRMLGEKRLEGKRVLIIGGRSEEPIDSMRVITNQSSGRMAVELAKASYEQGADTELWMGGCSVELPSHINIRRFTTVSNLIGMLPDIDHDIVIVPAALSDFSPEKVDGKIPSDKGLELSLEPTEKVLPLITKVCDNVIGFKAEPGLDKENLDKARARMDTYGLSAIVVNDVSAAGSDRSEAIIITREKEQRVSGTKAEIADAILG